MSVDVFDKIYKVIDEKIDAMRDKITRDVELTILKATNKALEDIIFGLEAQK